MVKVFIDGHHGTTGLRIHDRLKNRNDIELITISDDLRKDPNEIKKCINASDITFLCLPDDAAGEAVSLVENENTVIIDTSTLNRCNDNWAYGFPELGTEFYNKIKNSKRIANPGCYATGFISLAYPLVHLGIVDSNYPFSITGISGYSGAGNKGIKEYEDLNRDQKYEAPRLYAMGQSHKHLAEMQKIVGLDEKPIFNPFVCDYYSGMIVNISLYKNKLKKNLSLEEIHKSYDEFYKGKDLVKVAPFNPKGTESGYLEANKLTGKDYLEIYISGNEERIDLTAVLDNLGKGASGAAIESMNIVLGLDPKTGLNL